MTSRTYAEMLALAARFTLPACRQAARALDLPPGSRGLDAGCGIGTGTRMLAEETGGEVVGVDVNRDNLDAARKRTGDGPAAGRVSFQEANLLDLPFEDDTFDWAWCADTLWPVVVPDPVEGVRELARAVRPGGTVALLFWTGQNLLPGYPPLESRLQEAFVAGTRYFRIREPGQHMLRALGWLRRAELEGRRARSFVAEVQAPLDASMRESLAYLFEMLWEPVQDRLSDEDRAAWRRLCRPDAEDFIADDPDFYGFATYTLFSGRT